MPNAPHSAPEHTPSEALAMLLEGNERFASGEPAHPRQDVDRRTMLSTGQAPFAVILGCSDSRVPVELLFDQGFGDIFVVRNAGHVLGLSTQASVEFAVAQLGVQVVLVMGHESCGAVAATVSYIETGAELPGQMPVLVREVRPHLDEAHPAGDAVEAHVLGTLSDLLERSDLVRDACASGDVVVAGGVYALADGRVRLVTQH